MYEVAFETINNCRMDFEAYPFDVHYCYVLFTSWTYDETIIKLTTGKIVYPLEDQVVLLDYDIEIGPIPKGMERKIYGPNFAWSIAGFEMKLMRKPKKYLANYYAPTGMLVLVSWVCNILLLS